MGKATTTTTEERERLQQIRSNPNAVVDCECCTLKSFPFKIEDTPPKAKDDVAVERKELVIIGAGPHALTLMLRLLEPNADLMTDKERHIQADFKQRMRPLAQVRKHVKDILKGPSAVYKQGTKANDDDEADPPPLSLDFVKENVLVLDGTSTSEADGIHGWMASWMK